MTTVRVTAYSALNFWCRIKPGDYNGATNPKQHSRESLKSFIQSPRYRPETFSGICAELRVRGGERKKIKRLLMELQRTGEIAQLKNHRYVPASVPQKISGRLQYNRRGFGFVVPDDGTEDIFIAGENLGGALHGDRVTVEAGGKKGRGRNEGKIRDVLQRGIQTAVGRVRFGKDGAAHLVPFGHEVPYPIRLTLPLPQAYDRDADPVVAVRVDWKNSSGDLLRGNVEEVLGSLDDPSVDSKMVIFRNDLPRRFPDDALEEAKRIPAEIPLSEIEKREDLRALPFVTIDGADARDHDDAIALEEGGLVWVAIADVSHYVAVDRAVDREAAGRGNSYYFPDLVLPMLPERLSNDLCSLKPGVDRLVLAARLKISREGSLEDVKLCEGIIHSRARLTYESVDRALKTGGDAETPAEILPMLKKILALAEKMFAKRMSEGGIDFDLSETKVILDKHGVVTAMSRRERTPAQRVVEECMLAANKGVARVLRQTGNPAVYRVHEKPDERKLGDFLYLLRSYGYTATLDTAKADPFEIDRLLHRFDGDPRGKVFSYLALRSMRQAFYSPDNMGHYGLGFDDYLHFTSPIRRYADLVVHRIVRHWLRKEDTGTHLFPKNYETLENISSFISSRERIAQSAEREVRTIKGIRFFKDKIGKTFRGFVVGMVSQGIFIELEEHAVEGFVHISKLAGDHFDFFEREKTMKGRRSGKTIRLGNAVIARVDEASLEEFRLNFSIASFGVGEKPSPPPKR